MKLYRNWIINEVARAGEHTNERTYVLAYIRTGQTLYPLHNFVVRGDNDQSELNIMMFDHRRLSIRAKLFKANNVVS